MHCLLKNPKLLKLHIDKNQLVSMKRKSFAQEPEKLHNYTAVLEGIHLFSEDYFPTENSFQKFFLEADFPTEMYLSAYSSASGRQSFRNFQIDC